MISLLYQCGLLVFVYMTILFIIAQKKQDNSIVDIGWGIGFALIALFTFIQSGLYLPRQRLITQLVVIWGLRLAGHIFTRHKGEDPRYQAWRTAWTSHFYLRSFLQIFMLQGLLMFIISLPIIAVNASQTPGITIFDFIGLVLWLVGFVFEVVGDFQLQAFTQDPANKNRVMDKGVWRYTRHPNYFGEITMWWALWLIALNVPYGLWTIVSPLTITFLLLCVSGIPLLEKRYEGNAEYQAYKRKTSALIPWFAKD